MKTRKFLNLNECKIEFATLILMLFYSFSLLAQTEYSGVTFPNGDISFADRVVNFTPGSGSGELDASAVIGAPDGDKSGPSKIGAKGDVTLGSGGSVTIRFIDNYLIDIEGLDLYIYEFGPSVEAFKVEISKNGISWIDLGTVRGQPTGLDIKSKVSPGDRFEYVRVTSAEKYNPRNPNEIGKSLFTGSDIDAIGAIGTVFRPDPPDDIDDDPITGASDWEEVDVYEYNYRNWPNANWAEWGSVTVGSQIGGAASSRRTYLLFDIDKYLSTWNGNDKVELEFWGDSRKGSSATISIYRVNSSWNPGTGTYISGQAMPNAQNGEITWNNQPNIDFSREWSSLTIPANASYASWRWDITDLAREWKYNGLPNYGLVMMIKGEGSSVAQCVFSSSEADTNRPKLLFGGDPGNNITAKDCNEEGIYMYAEDRKGKKGSTVEMPVFICNVRDMANMDVTLNWNSSIGALQDVKKGSSNKAHMLQWNEVSKGNLKIAFAGSKAFDGSGSVAVLVYNLIGPDGSSTKVNGSISTANMSDGTRIPISGFAPGTLTISEPSVPGDCDGDDKLTERDALAALQIAVQKRPFDKCYDVNKDGKVDSQDARIIMRRIVGLPAA